MPVPEFAVPEIPVPGILVPGILVPEGRAALAATRRMGRSPERQTAGRSRSPTPAQTAAARTAAARTAAARTAAARGARRGRDGRGRRAALERRAATARGAGPHHAGGSPAVAPYRGAAAGPPGTGHVAGRPGSHRAGSLAGQPGSRAGRRRAAGRHRAAGQDRAAGRNRLAGRPRLASSVPGMTWAAEATSRPGPAVVPSPRLARGPGTLRPGIRAAVERSPCAAGRPREHPRTPRTPGASWSPEGRRTRETWPRPRSPARARRGERRSGHLANTRWSVSAPVPAPGPAPGTPPPGAGDLRADVGATFRPG
jgi:hypothetical protein